VLHNVVPQPEIHDIAHAWTWWAVLSNPLALIGGGAKAVQNAALRMRGVPWSYLRLRRVNIGGDIDQRDCRDCIERAAAEAKRTGSHLVVMGTSRGASTVLSTVLTLDPELAGAISLVVLEAPFDSVEHVVRNTSFAPRLILALLQHLGTYAGPERHATPLRTIDRVADASALKAPLAFITSKADRRVPALHTHALMDRLRQRHPGLTIHHLELAHAHHSAMSIRNDGDRDAYVRFMEGLYDRYCSGAGRRAGN
jgi:predicted esterase